MMPGIGGERFRVRRVLGFGYGRRAVLEPKGAVDIPADHLLLELGGLWALALWPTCSHTMMGVVKSRDYGAG